MRDLAILFLHPITLGVKLIRPGGARSIVAESLLLKHQLLILNPRTSTCATPAARRSSDRSDLRGMGTADSPSSLRNCPETPDDHELSPLPRAP